MSVEEPAPKRRRLRQAAAEPDLEADAAPGEAADIPMEAAEAAHPDASEAPTTAEPTESASAPPASAPPASAPTAGESDDEDSSSDSDSESDTSSSSSSSESSATESSEEEVDPALMEDVEEDKEKETSEQKKQRHLETVRTAQLRRNELMVLLSDIPQDEVEQYLKSAFVLVKTSENQVALAEVVGVEPSAPYQCRHPEHPKEAKRLLLQLRCKRGVSEKFIKASAISGNMIEEEHIQQWSKVMHRCRIDPELYLDSMKARAEQIASMKRIDYNEETVDQILSRKRKIEFDAQKQSRMACNVQIGLTQMDISSIKNFEMAELAQEHKHAQEQLQKMEKKEYEAQEHWFSSRRDLYGVKEINRMNVERQKRDDAHALKFALEQERESQEQTQINPFERRACRPVSAWDTSLTVVEELEEMKRKRLEREARAKQAKLVMEGKSKGKDKMNKEMETEESQKSKDLGEAELDQMVDAARDEPMSAAEPHAPENEASSGARRVQDLGSDSEAEDPQAAQRAAQEKERQEERQKGLELLKMYQELLRNAK